MPMISSGRSLVGVSSPGTAGSENTSLDLWTPAYHGFSAWNYDPVNSVTGLTSTSATCWAIRVFCPTAFTLSKVGVYVSAVINTGTAALTTTNTNSTDVTTLQGAGSLAVGANTFNASGTFTAPTTSPVGTVMVSYTGGGGGSPLTGCQVVPSTATGTIGAAATITQTKNSIGVFNNAGSTLLGVMADQVSAWGTLGFANGSLTILNGTTPSITAGSYVWVVFVSTGTASVRFQGTQSTAVAGGPAANSGIASVANLRFGQVSASQAFFPATITPGSLTNTGTAGPGEPWVCLT